MNKAEAERLFRRADELYQGKNYAAALDLLDLLDAAYPDQHRILYPRAMCLAEVGRTDEAIALCDRLLAHHGYLRANELKGRIQRQESVQSTRPDPATLSAKQGRDEFAPFSIDEGPSAFKVAPRPETRAARGRTMGLAAAGLVMIVAAAAAGGGYYLYTQQERAGAPVEAAAISVPPPDPAPAAPDRPTIDLSGPPELIRIESHTSEDGVTVNASVEFGVWTDCGGYGCFVEKFRACEPAAIRLQTMGAFIVEYRVVGERDGACQLEMTVVDMPPYPDWAGKSMTCPCDTSKDFMKITEEIGPGGVLDGTLECEGPLFEAMHATFADYLQQPR